MTDTNLGPLYAVASTIEGIVLDVDGVLTDGKITYTSDGNELKVSMFKTAAASNCWPAMALR